MSPTGAEEAQASNDKVEQSLSSSQEDGAKSTNKNEVGSRDEQLDSDKEDPPTAAATKDLQQATISDHGSPVSETATSSLPAREHEMSEGEQPATPRLVPDDTHDLEIKDGLTSPKKKRARDEDPKDIDGKTVEVEQLAANGSAAHGSRTGLEPEKKRPREITNDPSATENTLDSTVSASAESNTEVESNETKASKDPESSNPSENPKTDQPQTSSSAFASSGFASLASSTTSPFGALNSDKPSVFGGGAKSGISGFGALGGAASPPSTTLGGSSNSGFGSMASSGFGSLGGGLSGGFGGGGGFASGATPKLSSFAAPGKSDLLGSEKPAKAFGAPESEDEEDEDEDDEDEKSDEEEKETNTEKKVKLNKIPVEDGEAGEATLFQVRAKLFALDKEAGWKERGVGTVKINVPKACVDFDDNGTPIPGSFDISGLEMEEPDTPSGAVRLIMRQESTHRVILNTLIVKAMQFQDKSVSTGVRILFTAFEDTKPVNMLLKMNEASATQFLSEIKSIQREQ